MNTNRKQGKNKQQNKIITNENENKYVIRVMLARKHNKDQGRELKRERRTLNINSCLSTMT